MNGSNRHLGQLHQRDIPSSSLSAAESKTEKEDLLLNGWNEESCLDIAIGDGQWLVLHTRPRCEKKVLELCKRNAMNAYLPLRKKVHRYGSREKPFWSPLFPGYVFGLATVQQKAFLSQNQYVANVLVVMDQELLLSQLRRIAQALEAGNVAEVLPYLEKGKPVRVTGGPFKGIEGIVLRIKGKTKVVLNVDIIQQAIAVEVDSAHLLPA